MPLVSTVASIQPIHLRRTLALQALGQFDPSAVWVDDTFTKVFLTPAGLCAVRLSRVDDGLKIEAEGEDAASVVAQVQQAVADDDGYHAFAPDHDGILQHHRRNPGLRLLRVPWLFDVACSAVLQQRVRTTEAFAQWSTICRRFGEKAPGGLIAFPSPETLSQAPLHTLQAMGIDPRRGRVLLNLAREISMHPLRPDVTREYLKARMGRVHGVGPWTSAMILGYGTGDTDAVPVGDLHLPHMVCYAFSGAMRGTDATHARIARAVSAPSFSHRAAALLRAGISAAGLMQPVLIRANRIEEWVSHLQL